VGFSFGAWVGLRVGADDPRVSRLVGLGIPVNVFDFSYLEGIAKPLLLVHGGQDEWGALATVQTLVATMHTKVRLEVIPGSDHFFRAHFDTVAASVVAFLAPSASA